MLPGYHGAFRKKPKSGIRTRPYFKTDPRGVT
jgi:hypothetical protein